MFGPEAVSVQPDPRVETPSTAAPAFTVPHLFDPRRYNDTNLAHGYFSNLLGGLEGGAQVRLPEPGRFRRRSRLQDAVLGRGDSPQSCRDRGSTPRSCSSAVFV